MKREDGKMFEMFRSDYVYSGQKAARLLKLIGKREKIPWLSLGSARADVKPGMMMISRLN